MTTENPPAAAPTFEEFERMARFRALFPESWIVNGVLRTVSTFVPVVCGCGPDAIPGLRYIGDDSIPRELVCERCGTHLAEIVHNDWEPREEAL